VSFVSFVVGHSNYPSNASFCSVRGPVRFSKQAVCHVGTATTQDHKHNVVDKLQRYAGTHWARLPQSGCKLMAVGFKLMAESFLLLFLQADSLSFPCVCHTIDNTLVIREVFT